MLKLMLVSLMIFGGMVSCVSSKEQKQLEQQIQAVRQQQDSLIAILNTMKDQTNFIAYKVGWRPPEDTLPKDIPLAGSYSHGAEKPVLTLVEFSDFQCPYCAQLSPTLDSLVRTYPEKIKVVFKHFPLSFHKQAMSAHAAALAAGKQGRFFDYRYKLASKFRNLNDSVYIALAEEIGLDMEEFKKDMPLTKDVESIIDKDKDLGVKIGVSGTPTLFANGKKVRDRSFDGLVQLMKSYGG